MSTSFVLPLIFFGLGNGTCAPPAVSHVFDSVTSICYYVSMTYHDLTSAEQECASYGGSLSEIPGNGNLTFASFVELMTNYGVNDGELLYTGYYINDSVVTIRSSNTEVTQTNWAVGEPDYQQGNKSCVAVLSNNMTWYAVGCSSLLKSLCSVQMDIATVAPVVPPCGLLSPPANGLIEYSTDFVTANVTCDRWYNMTSGDSQLTCTGTTWFGSMPTCEILQCKATSNGNMTFAKPEVDLGENVTVTCLPGYAFHVNHTSKEAITNGTFHCVPDNFTSSARFSADASLYDGVCTSVTCPAMENIAYSYNDLVIGIEYEYGESVTFNCTAGYLFRIEHLQWPPQVTTTCTETGQWSEDLSGKSCKKDMTYVGCYESGTIIPITSFSLTGQLYCTNLCTDLDFRYAASSLTNCSCGNYLNESTSQLGAMTCNKTCPSVPTQNHFAYCGGHNGEESIYYTVRTSCYQYVNITRFATFSVTGSKLLTCKQLCLGMDAFYTIYIPHLRECVCTNSSDFGGITIYNVHCQDTALSLNMSVYDVINMGYFEKIIRTGFTYELHTYLINTLDSFFKAEVEPSYTSCEAVYEAGVKDNGIYNIKHTGKTYCSFKDGTSCPTGWIGYKGNCYLFTPGNYTFMGAAEYCQNQESTLASLLTADENSFAKHALSTFEEFQGSSKRWFIGLYDPRSLTAYTWNDGNLLLEQHFASEEPRDENLNCVVLNQDDGQWYSHNCGDETNVICKQSPDNPFCLQLESIQDPEAFNTSKSDMTLTMCRQICLARNFTYSLAWKESCTCVNTLTYNETTPLSLCNSGCPGNNQQFCGGIFPGFYTVANVTNSSKAVNCEDLQSQGLTGDIYLLRDNDNVTTCEDTGCPYSWIKGNSSCYKLMLGKKSFGDAASYCSNYSSYLLVLETEPEANFVLELVNNLTFYNAASEWILGVRMTGQFTNQYTWANGYSGGTLLKNFTDVDSLRQGYFTSTEWKLGGHSSTRSYICEQNEVYLGCFMPPSEPFTAIADYKYMSVEQCVESCRSAGYNYSLVQERKCACTSELQGKSETSCVFCNIVQPCGPTDSDAYSAYNIWAYQPFDSCEEAYDSGVLLSGDYVIGGVPTTCHFYDNTSCPTTDWIGYKGKCYLYIDKKQTIEDLVKTCRNYSGNVLTIGSLEEHNFLRKVLKGHWRYGGKTIHVGLMDEFNMSVYTWVTGTIPSYFPQPSYSNTLFFGTTMTLSSSSDYDMQRSREELLAGFCEINNDYYGCAEVPSISNAIVANYNNMDVTLCKQLCMGNASLNGYALVQETNCYCIEDPALLSASNDSMCDVQCPGNRGQMCGSDHVGHAYKLNESDIVANCSTLYYHGVLLGGTYLSQTNGNISAEQCGYHVTDTTSCATGWYGKDGYCYYFYPVTVALGSAISACHEMGGYVFTPDTQSAKLMAFSILNTLYGDVHLWWTSLIDVLLNQNMRLGDGRMVLPTNSNYTVDQNIYVLLNSTLMSQEKQSSAAGNHGVVCEKSPGYFGCKASFTSMSSITNTQILSESMTATLCIQHCMGVKATYAAVQVNVCNCLDGSAEFNETISSCESCPGFSPQPCGSDNGDVSVYSLTHYSTNLAESCFDLYNMGVRDIGWYMIKPPGQDPVQVSCFAEVKKFILSSTITASSHLEPYTPAQSRLWDLNTESSVWIPDPTDPNPWIQYDLEGDYVVLGIATQGRFDVANGDWTESLQISYKHVISDDWISIGQFDGNKDRSSLNIQWFPVPFVSDSVRIYPLSTSVRPALRLLLIGDKMTTLNRTEPYVGCYAFFNTSKTYETTLNVESQDECKSLCFNVTQFYSYDNTTEVCECLSYLDANLDDINPECNETHAVKIYKTYDLECSSPPIVNYSSNASAFAHFPNAHTIKSSVVYTCDTGYEFSDNTSTKTVTCDGRSWTNLFSDTCDIVRCPALNAGNSVLSTSNLVYGTEVLLTCNEGYILNDGSKQRAFLCGSDKTWNATIESCQPINCGVPEPVNNTQIIGSLYTYNSSVLHVCDENMRFAENEYNKTVRCAEDGQWETVNGSCEVYQCGPPPTVWMATYTRINGTLATYSCPAYYVFPDRTSNKTATCGVDFLWEALPDCILDDTVVTQKGVDIIFVGNKQRVVTADLMSHLLKETRSDSKIDCGDQCFRIGQCMAFNFNNNLDQNCVLFRTLAESSNLVSSTDWSYFEVYAFSFFP